MQRNLHHTMVYLTRQYEFVLHSIADYDTNDSRNGHYEWMRNLECMYMGLILEMNGHARIQAGGIRHLHVFWAGQIREGHS